MNKFKFAYSKGAFSMIALAGVLSAAGLVWNIYTLASTRDEELLQLLAYSLSILVCGALFAFCVSAAVYGRYVFKNGYLYLYFGFFRTKTKTDDVVQITRFLKSDKLVIYYKDAKYSVVVISPEYYAEFIAALKRANPSVMCDADEERQGQ